VKTSVGTQVPENLKKIKPNNRLFVQHKQMATGTGVSGYSIYFGLRKKRYSEAAMYSEVLLHPSRL